MSAKQQYAVYPVTEKGATKLRFKAVAAETVSDIADVVQKDSNQRDFFLVRAFRDAEVPAIANSRKLGFDQWAQLELAA